MKWQEVFDFSHLITAKSLTIGTIGASLGGVVSQIFVDDTLLIWMKIFLIVIGLDWIGGMMAAKKDKVYATEYGIHGVFRVAAMLLLPMAGHLVDTALGLPNLAFFLLLSTIGYHTWESMTANFARAGWDRWIPNKVLVFIGSEIQAKANRSLKRYIEIHGEKNDEKGNK